jgi:hypothetical protein
LRSLAPFVLPGGYANPLGPDDREQAEESYGGNAARLRVFKRRFDPDGVFTSPSRRRSKGPAPS